MQGLEKQLMCCFHRKTLKDSQKCWRTTVQDFKKTKREDDSLEAKYKKRVGVSRLFAEFCTLHKHVIETEICKTCQWLLASNTFLFLTFGEIC